MEAVPCVAPLDELVAKLRAHREPPQGLKMLFFSPLNFTINVAAVSSDRDLVSLELAWTARVGAHEPGRFACEVAAKGGKGRDFKIVASGESRDAAQASALFGASSQPKVFGQVTWSWLRGAVAEEGASLEAALVMLPKAPPVGPTNACALRVAGGGAGTFTAAGGAMLDGPFTDVAVAAGGQTFRAHRVVLAAASPVFLSMLEGGMREAREAVVELRGADPAIVELLLRHIYGGAIEVPLPLALPLYALADQYQLSSGLQRQLRLWLASLQLAPDALCELCPAALYVCPQLATGSWSAQAVASLPALSVLPAFGSWPVDAVVEVIKSPTAPTLAAFEAALRWMEGQEKPAKQRHRWGQLLDSISWASTTVKDLQAMRRHPQASEVPGLQERLLDAWERLGTWLPAGAQAIPRPSCSPATLFGGV